MDLYAVGAALRGLFQGKLAAEQQGYAQRQLAQEQAMRERQQTFTEDAERFREGLLTKADERAARLEFLRTAGPDVVGSDLYLKLQAEEAADARREKLALQGQRVQLAGLTGRTAEPDTPAYTKDIIPKLQIEPGRLAQPPRLSLQVAPGGLDYEMAAMAQGGLPQTAPAPQLKLKQQREAPSLRLANVGPRQDTPGRQYDGMNAQDLAALRFKLGVPPGTVQTTNALGETTTQVETPSLAQVAQTGLTEVNTEAVRENILQGKDMHVEKLKGAGLANALSAIQVATAGFTLDSLKQLAPVQLEQAKVSLATLSKQLAILGEKSKYLPQTETANLAMVRAQVALVEKQVKHFDAKAASDLATEASARSYQQGMLGVARTNASTNANELAQRRAEHKVDVQAAKARAIAAYAKAVTAEERAQGKQALDLIERAAEVLAYYDQDFSDPDIKPKGKRPTSALLRVLKDQAGKLPAGPVQTDILRDLAEVEDAQKRAEAASSK